MGVKRSSPAVKCFPFSKVTFKQASSPLNCQLHEAVSLHAPAVRSSLVPSGAPEPFQLPTRMLNGWSASLAVAGFAGGLLGESGLSAPELKIRNSAAAYISGTSGKGV